MRSGQDKKLNQEFYEAKTPFVLAISSGKGGVGKSVVASNMAYELSELGKKVLVWDCDMQFPNQHLIIGVEPPVRLSHVYSDMISIDKAYYKVKQNFDLLADLPAAGISGEYSPNALIETYNKIIFSSDYDVIIIDTPAGGNNNVIQAAEISDRTAIIITDEPTSLLDAYALIKILMEIIDQNEIRLLVNNVIDFEDADEMSHKLNLATTKFLKMQIHNYGFIPYDRAIRQSIIMQKLICREAPEAEASIHIRKIAKIINQEVDKKLIKFREQTN